MAEVAATVATTAFACARRWSTNHITFRRATVSQTRPEALRRVMSATTASG
jgi:hypothetical protein